jgi:hypothetical protein
MQDEEKQVKGDDFDQDISHVDGSLKNFGLSNLNLNGQAPRAL